MIKNTKQKLAILLAAAVATMVLFAGCPGDPDPEPGPSGPTSYTVTFDQNYQGAPAATTKTVTAPATTVGTLPTAPTRLNYNFVGWFTVAANTGGTQFLATTPVTASITVYARWIDSANAVTITFDLNGGSGTAPSPITVESGSNVTPPADPERSGYTFSGWFTAASGGSAFVFTGVTASATVYAQWIAANAITVTFDENGGDTEANPKVIPVGANGTISALPTPPTYEGFFFGGWNTQADGDGDVFTAATTVTASITVYAVWSTEAVTVDFTVTFTKNSYGPGTADVEKKVTTMGGFVTDIPNNFALDAPWNAGVTFASWNTAADGTGSAFTASTAVNQSMNVYAIWAFAEGSIVVDADTLVHNAPPMETNQGEGAMQGTWWNGNTINTDGSVTFVSGDSTIAGGNNPLEYQGGTVRYMFPQDGLPAGESIADYDFVELQYAHTLAGNTGGVTTPLKTIWKKGKSDVDFNSMSGGPYQNLTVSAAGATSSLPLFPIKLAGYSNITGALDATGPESGIAIQRSNFGGTVKFVKAVFTKGTRYTITLDTGYPAGEDFDDISAVATVAINELPTPEDREGYVFAGWFDESETPAKLYSNVTVMPAQDLTLTAHWNVYKPTAPITVDFTGMTFRSIGGTSTVELLENDEEEVIGYTFTNTAYGSGQAFTVKLPTGFFLGDYDKISFTITKEDQDTYTDADFKSCYVLGGKPQASGSTANNNVSTYTGSPQNITGGVTTEIVLPIDKASTLTTVTLSGGDDPIELVVYINSGPNGAKYSVTNFRIYQD